MLCQIAVGSIAVRIRTCRCNPVIIGRRSCVAVQQHLLVFSAYRLLLVFFFIIVAPAMAGSFSGDRNRGMAERTEPVFFRDFFPAMWTFFHTAIIVLFLFRWRGRAF